jgi:hypothetical protein
MSQEYAGAIVLVIGALLKVFGIEVASDAIQGIVVGVIAVWIAIRRFQKGDIKLSGVRK